MNNIQSRIPLGYYAEIMEIGSPPDEVVRLLNEAEESVYPFRISKLNKRIYPYWKVCASCLSPFMVRNFSEFRRKYCPKNTCGYNLSHSVEPSMVA